MKLRPLYPIIFLLLLGCELFTPRDPEPPINNQDPYAWLPPTSPEIVLENLANAFPANKPNYFLDALSQDQESENAFTFLPDQSVASSQPDVFTDWGYEAEESFITKLFQALESDGLQRLTWDVTELNPIDNHYKVIADYRLTLSFISNDAQLPDILAGQATLTLIQNSELLYEVSLWQDFQSDTLACWSALKAQVQ